MSIDDVLAELKDRYSAAFGEFKFATDLKFSNLNDADVERWRAGTASSRNDLYDLLALRLAHGYHRREMPFTFCDAILNDIFRVMIGADEHSDLF